VRSVSWKSRPGKSLAIWSSFNCLLGRRFSATFVMCKYANIVFSLLQKHTYHALYTRNFLCLFSTFCVDFYQRPWASSRHFLLSCQPTFVELHQSWANKCISLVLMQLSRPKRENSSFSALFFLPNCLHNRTNSLCPGFSKAFLISLGWVFHWWLIFGLHKGKQPKSQ